MFWKVQAPKELFKIIEQSISYIFFTLYRSPLLIGNQLITFKKYYRYTMYYYATMRPKILAVILLFQKKNSNPYFIVIMITVLILIGIFWVVNFKTIIHFLLHRTFTSGYYLCTTALMLFIHRIFGTSELYTIQIDWQNKNMHVKMTRIEGGVTVRKGLFILDGNVEIMTANIF
jgi:hypothetical protein